VGTAGGDGVGAGQQAGQVLYKQGEWWLAGGKGFQQVRQAYLIGPNMLHVLLSSLQKKNLTTNNYFSNLDPARPFQVSCSQILSVQFTEVRKNSP
jgi:hypothetical protein